jgi:hypothetical protein
MRCHIFIVSLFILSFSCSDNRKIDDVLKLADSNKVELQKVINHYKKLGDERKLEAAKFLIGNMDENHYWYEGDIISKYDTILYLYHNFWDNGIKYGEPSEIHQTWDYLTSTYGDIIGADLNLKYDCQVLNANFLIRNIDIAFEAWEKSPLYNPDEFELFCQYILPYRIQNETVEEYRTQYYNDLKIIVDTATSVENIVKGFNKEFRWKREYRVSEILWKYPFELSVSKMELGHRGACRQLTTYCALAMKACGLPVTIDKAIWANRSQGLHGMS